MESGEVRMENKEFIIQNGEWRTSNNHSAVLNERD